MRFAESVSQKGGYFNSFASYMLFVLERAMLFLFNAMQVTEGHLELEAKQQSEVEIDQLAFAPIGGPTVDGPLSAALSLVSCGGNSIRFWRVKQQRLPHASLALGEYGRGHQFTSLSFAHTYGDGDVCAVVFFQSYRFLIHADH